MEGGLKAPTPPTLQQQGYCLARLGMATLMFIAVTLCFVLRVNINIALVAMVDSSAGDDGSGGSSGGGSSGGGSSGGGRGDGERGDVCPVPAAGNVSVGIHTAVGHFTWNEFQQSLIIGAFYWGYIWWQIPGGRLSEVVGPRLVMTMALMGPALLSLLLPPAANFSYLALVMARAAIGFFAGALPASCQVLLASWAPPHERSFLVAYVFSGAQIGTVLGYNWTAAILDSMNWEAVFYIQGALALAWSVLLFLLVRDSPKRALWISQAELDYIVDSVGESKKDKPLPMPWKAAFTSLPVWAIVAATISLNWGFSTLLAGLPLYMKEILHQDIKTNAWLCSAPYLGMWLMSLIMSGVGDSLRRRGVISTTTLRKTAGTISLLGPAVCIFSLTYVECNFWATFVLLFVAVTLHGGIYSSYIANHIDIAPNFAGTIYGMTNSAGVIPAFLGPMTTGILTNGQQTLGQWSKIFYITATFYALGALFYLAFASGVEQPWNRPSHTAYIPANTKEDPADSNGHSVAQHWPDHQMPSNDTTNTTYSVSLVQRT